MNGLLQFNPDKGVVRFREAAMFPVPNSSIPKLNRVTLYHEAIAHSIARHLNPVYWSRLSQRTRSTNSRNNRGQTNKQSFHRLLGIGLRLTTRRIFRSARAILLNILDGLLGKGIIRALV